MCPNPSKTEKQPPTPGETRPKHRPRRKDAMLFHNPRPSEWARVVRDRLKALDMLPAQFARTLGVSKTAMSDYLHGRVRPPLPDISTWAQVLDVPDHARFNRLALLAYAPPEVSDLFLQQESELLRMASVLRELMSENLELRKAAQKPA